MSESLGSAALYLTVDTTDMQQGVERAKRSIKGLSSEAASQFERSTSAQKKLAESYVRTASYVGKSALEIKALNAEARIGGKLGAEIAEQYRKLDAAAKSAANNATKAFSGTAVSARQTAAAMRGVPAQITDIFTSLQGGQNPLTVLLQQGGQLKDMFGGIVPAARALGSSLAGLVSPATAAAGAAAALGFAWYQATERGVELNKALILTGNTAATSADELQRMASRLDSATSATAGKATEVLALVASTGRFTAEQIELVTQAAINMEAATGKAVSETIKEFVGLQDDPVDAILSLNKAQNFLTEETLKSITSLKAQGREADAAAVAVQAYADTINTRAPRVIENLGLFATAWREVRSSAAETWDEVVNGFGRADVAAKEALTSMSRYMSAFGNGPAGALSLAFSGSGPMPSEAKAAASTALTTAQAKAALEFDKEGLRYASQRQRMEREIKEARALGLKAGKSELEINERIAAIRASYTDKAPKVRQARTRKATTRERPDFAKDAARELERLAAQEERATQSFLDMKAALDGPLAEALRDHETRVASLNKMAQESPIAAQGLADALEQEAERYRETADAIKRHLDPLGQLLEAQRHELDMIGLSNAERAVMNVLIEKGIDLRSRDAQAALAQARANEAEAATRQQQIEVMDDFRQGAEDALVAVATGAKSAKDALKDFFNELAAQATRLAARNILGNLFGPQGSSGAGTSGGNWLASLVGALFGGGGASAAASTGGGQFAWAGAGYAMGGYTGDGPDNEVAGVVHRGEYVVPAPVVRAIRNGNGKGGSQAGFVQNVSYTLQGRVSREVEAQIAQRTGTAVQRSMARNR